MDEADIRNENFWEVLILSRKLSSWLAVEWRPKPRVVIESQLNIGIR